MSDFLLADDLSGALDAAAAFHAEGWRVTVVLSEAAWPAGGAREMVAFTTETRNAAPGPAADAVSRAIALGRNRGGRLVYKKIDSTLRGPVASELAALLRMLPGTRVLFAPANPAVGRTVRDGVLLVHGTPVSRTEFGRDAVSPVRESEIRRLLGELATERVIIPDTTTAADLAAAVAGMEATESDWVGVGSGALARPIASRRTGDVAGEKGQRTGTRGSDERWPLVPEPTAVPVSSLPSPVVPRVPCLMVCGSAHAINREQAAAFSRARGVPLLELRAGTFSDAIGAATAALFERKGANLLIEMQRQRDSAALVRSIATAVAGVMTATAVRRVFVTGGETAFALCPLLGVTTLTFRAEIEPGLSLSSADTPDGRIWFAIKPGGFGDAQTWIRAWDALQGV